MIDMNLVGKKCGPIPYEYTWKDVVLYALSIGAQPDELSFIYENARDGLKVIPSFCVVMCHNLFVALFKDVKIDASRFIHGEEAMKLYRPIPPEGKVITEGEITNIYDKGKGALIIWGMRILTESGDILAEAEHTIFYVGAGGFGGDPGPKAEALNPPQGIEPDFIASVLCPRKSGSSIPAKRRHKPSARGSGVFQNGWISSSYSSRTMHVRLCGKSRAAQGVRGKCGEIQGVPCPFFRCGIPG